MMGLIRIVGIVVVAFVVIALALLLMVGWPWSPLFVWTDFKNGQLTVRVPNGTDKILLQDKDSVPPNAIYWTSTSDRKDLEIVYFPRQEIQNHAVKEEKKEDLHEPLIRRTPQKVGTPRLTREGLEAETASLADQIDKFILLIQREREAGNRQSEADRIAVREIATKLGALTSALEKNRKMQEDASAVLRQTHDIMHKAVMATQDVALEVKILSSQQSRNPVDFKGLQDAIESIASELKVLASIPIYAQFPRDFKQLLSHLNTLVTELKDQEKKPVQITVEVMKIVTHPNPLAADISPLAIGGTVVKTSFGTFLLRKVDDVLHVFYKNEWHPIKVEESVLLVDMDSVFMVIGFLEEVLPYLP